MPPAATPCRLQEGQSPPPESLARTPPGRAGRGGRLARGDESAAPCGGVGEAKVHTLSHRPDARRRPYRDLQIKIFTFYLIIFRGDPSPRRNRPPLPAETDGVREAGTVTRGPATAPRENVPRDRFAAAMAGAKEPAGGETTRRAADSTPCKTFEAGPRAGVPIRVPSEAGSDRPVMSWPRSRYPSSHRPGDECGGRRRSLSGVEEQAAEHGIGPARPRDRDQDVPR